MSTEFSDSSFKDQCHLLCLGYLEYISINDSDYDRDDSKILKKTVEKEISSLNFNCNDVISAANFLADLSFNLEISSVGKVAISVKMVWHDELGKDEFDVAAESLLENECVSSWEEIALILHFMDRTMRVRGLSEFNLIVGLTAEYLAVSSKKFVFSGNTWKSALDKPPVEEEQPSDGILSSMIMVQKPEADNGVRSSPFSVSPPVIDEERDSLNSATPPELVDRPPMTASLMQIIGAGDTSNHATAASSESTEFEMVGSIYSAVPSTPGSPKALSEPGAERSADESVSRRATPSPVSVSSSTEKGQQLPFDVKKFLPEGATEYLPQLSVGVAAAAACIGLLMFKKATS